MKQSDTILCAAYSLPQPFTAADLVVAAWKTDKAFSLPGYDHPDSNMVLAYLMGKDGMVERGLLKRVAPKTYEITVPGKERARQLLGLAPERPKTVRVPAPLAEEFCRMRDNLPAKGSLPEACQFWGCSMLTAPSVTGRISSALEELEALLTKQDGVLPSGEQISYSDAVQLRRTHAALLRRYRSALNMVRSRDNGTNEGRAT